MTLLLVRKLLRDVRPALVVVCILLFLFSSLWVKITQRVTTEISPFLNIVAGRAALNPRLFEEILFRGPGKVAQAVIGGADVRFERPADFLAVGMLHPVVLILSSVWAIGRAGGAVAGELDRGTMELLLSQPLPRNQLILAHFLVDCVVIPTVCLSIFAGTQFGLWAVGPFTVDYSSVQKLLPMLELPEKPEILEVSGKPQLPALANLAALLFSLSGITLALSAAGRSRWKVLGYGVLVAMLMFIANVLGQLWDEVEFVRPFSVFYYYQPQKIMLHSEWTVDPAVVWGSRWTLGAVPVVGALLAVGMAGYLAALRIFTRRDLPAPL